jgi:hypothetical protein
MSRNNPHWIYVFKKAAHADERLFYYSSLIALQQTFQIFFFLLRA